MQIKNIVIFSSTVAADGAWIDISNLVSFSLNITGLEGNVWVEVSNDPNVNIDGANALNAPATPALSQYAYGPLVIQDPSQSPAQTFYVVTTYITKYGETLASTEASLAVAAGKVLTVASPVQDAAGIATGYNVYVGLTSGSEVLQTNPPYTPAWQVDSLPGVHFAGSGAYPIGRPFTMISFIPSGVNAPISGSGSPPPASTAGGPNSGVNITGNLVGGSSPNPSDEICIVVSGTSAIVAPSCLVWKWLRVNKSGGGSSQTIAYLMGQNG